MDDKTKKAAGVVHNAAVELLERGEMRPEVFEDLVAAKDVLDEHGEALDRLYQRLLKLPREVVAGSYAYQILVLSGYDEAAAHEIITTTGRLTQTVKKRED